MSIILYHYSSLHIDIQCNNLTTPSNGEITSCSSGSIGVGYERDTCSFTCSTGYELTGSGTRTCQSDRNWSGDEVMCNKIKGMYGIDMHAICILYYCMYR